jgi:hypothetical protein
MTKTISFQISNFGYSCLPAGRGIYLLFGAWDLVLVLVVVGRFGRQFLLNAGGVDDDGRFPVDWALVLTDATARALLFFNDGPLLLITHDRMVGTLLIADEANLFRIPGNASGFVDMSDTHLEETFFFNGER